MSDDVDLLMKTYAHGKFVSSKLHRKLGIAYARKVGTYLCRLPMRAFLSYDAFTGGVKPPAAASIRSSFNNAENSTLTPCGFSNFDRYEREMQSVHVSKNDKVAFVWTFQTIKTTTYQAQRLSSPETRVPPRRLSLWPLFPPQQRVKYLICCSKAKRSAKNLTP
jgi:hypothetical protein